MRNGERGPWPESMPKWTDELLGAGRVRCQDVSAHPDEPGLVRGPCPAPAGLGSRGQSLCGLQSLLFSFGKTQASSQLGEVQCEGFGRPCKSYS